MAMWRSGRVVAAGPGLVMAVAILAALVALAAIIIITAAADQ